MIWIVGVPVRQEDAQSLVTKLLADGSPAAVEAARTIGQGLDAHRITVWLTNKERIAILRVLRDPPHGLVEVRDMLVRQVPDGDGANDSA